MLWISCDVIIGALLLFISTNAICTCIVFIDSTGHPADAGALGQAAAIGGAHGARLPRLCSVFTASRRQLDHAEWRRVCARLRVRVD